jgi:hypothetical protein
MLIPVVLQGLVIAMIGLLMVIAGSILGRREKIMIVG